jgi:hypothetical protein
LSFFPFFDFSFLGSGTLIWLSQVNCARLPQAYEALLAAMYAKQLSTPQRGAECDEGEMGLC